MSRIVWVLVLALTASAQVEEERTRELWDTNLLAQRPAGKKTKHSAPKKLDDALVGITLWRLRPSKPTDEPGVRALIHEDTGSHEWTPERIPADTPLRAGDKVRISIETARKAYLYVIDRDEYADGSKSGPSLIFPTLRTRGGNNHVMPGTVVEIPSADDIPPFFTVKRSRDDHVNELLTVLVSAEPIAGLEIGRDPLKLTDRQVADWETRWKATVHRLEAKALAGQPLTVAEKQAGTGDRQLTADDPVPQTMYRVDAKGNAPLLVEVALRIAK
jgi:hypothetical protein